MSLDLDFEHTCPWPREGLSSEGLSFASHFFCVLGHGLEPCVVDSTSGPEFRWSSHRLLFDWKRTVLLFFLHGPFVLKYTDSSNQRDFFFMVNSFYKYIQGSQSNTRDCKNFRRRANSFFQCSSLFFSARQFLVC